MSALEIKEALDQAQDNVTDVREEFWKIDGIITELVTFVNTLATSLGLEEDVEYPTEKALMYYHAGYKHAYNLYNLILAHLKDIKNITEKEVE